MTVTTWNHKLGIEDVSHIDVTETVVDGGVFVREIRVYGPAGTDAPPVVILRTSAATRDALAVSTPELRF